MSDPVLVAIISGCFSLGAIYLTHRLSRQNREDRELSDKLVDSLEQVNQLYAEEIRRRGGSLPTPGKPEVKP